VYTKTDVELHYPSEVTYFLKQQKKKIIKTEPINEDESVKIIYLQHEFGLLG
jgi:predicted nucleic acid-binding protein